ncbi:MAG: LPS export ABC transporter periplasmic protein LptC [Rhodobacteraceae bacterium]|jgi:lipopolysaccharide export system protein LptC|nr:LPS export ABC transporter periplasmic protein LptC [Paracoccaceae bacterium]
MAGIDRHSRLVNWLKVGLPLVALALLSTLFLLGDRIDPSDAIPYAEVDVEALARNPRMTAPSYAGTTSDGAEISVTAEAARPATADRTAAALRVTAELRMPGGGSAEILAGTAEIDTGAGVLRLSDGVTLISSSGYRIETPGLDTALDRSHAESTGPVEATGPAGRIEAQNFTLERQDGDGTGGKAYLLVFSEQVKLIYLPGGKAPDTEP